MGRVLIVGAGVAGLTVASELAPTSSVTVIDRLPAVGGSHGYDHPLVWELERRCRGAGVDFQLGTTALRWRDGHLLVAAPGRIRWLDGHTLVHAGGCRPATPAELRLAGSRLGGVLSATVAVHLLEAQARLGQRPLVIGVGDWAEAIATHFRQHRVPVCIVSSDEGERPDYADEWWPGWTAERTLGRGRVSGLIVTRAGHRERIACDALVLADQPRPLRNVEGAISGGENVVFVQLAMARATAGAVAAHAREMAQALRTTIRRATR